MNTPELWMNGRQLETTATARATVASEPELTWGTRDTDAQPPAATLRFSIIFRDGMHDMPDLQNGARVELVHTAFGYPPERITVFAGEIITTAAEASEDIPGALLVTATARDTTGEFSELFVSTALPAGTNRPAQLREKFAAEGWTLNLPEDTRPSAAARYNSIKLATVLDRHLTRYRGRRYDLTERDAAGTLQKRVQVTEGSPRTAPADELLATDAGWHRTYKAPLRDGEPSPLAVIPAANIRRNVGWTQEPGSAVTAVRLTPLTQGEDGLTEDGEEKNYRAPADVVARFGLTSLDIETDLAQPAHQEEAARAWMAEDNPWTLDQLEVVDSAQLPEDLLADLLNPATRNRLLVAIDGVMHNRPDPGPSVIRSYLAGGRYTWNAAAGKWEMVLTLERTIYAHPEGFVRFAEISTAFDRNIYAASFESIGPALSFADFREIDALQPAAGELWTFAALHLPYMNDTFATLNPHLTFAHFKTLRKTPTDALDPEFFTSSAA